MASVSLNSLQEYAIESGEGDEFLVVTLAAPHIFLPIFGHGRAGLNNFMCVHISMAICYACQEAFQSQLRPCIFR